VVRQEDAWEVEWSYFGARRVMKNWNKSVYRAVASEVRARQRLIETKKEAEEAKKKAEDAESARKLLQGVASTVQQKAHGQIASVVSRCLEAVFDDPYEFRVVFAEKRGRTEADMQFVKGGNLVDPMTASGGGVVDVAAFAARLARLMLSRPARRRLLVLDEPFRFVSRDLRPRVRELMETLSSEMEVQFVLVTHDPQLAVGKVVELS